VTHLILELNYLKVQGSCYVIWYSLLSFGMTAYTDGLSLFAVKTWKVELSLVNLRKLFCISSVQPLNMGFLKRTSDLLYRA
jgi:hypothetical protein